ncbi:Lanosterol 14-alpha demethylase, partial [Termitomyces sp. T112]
MAQSMLLLIIGEENPDPELIAAALKVVQEIATVSGLYQNIGYWSRTFPTTWRVLIWIKVIFLTIPWASRKIVRRVWKDLKQVRRTGNAEHMDPDCLLRFLIEDSRRIPGIMESISYILITFG